MPEPIQLTVYLIDGTHEYVEIYREIGDAAEVLMSLRRDGCLTTNDAFYPLHAIVKLKFGWDPLDMMHDALRSQRSRKKR